MDTAPLEIAACAAAAKSGDFNVMVTTTLPHTATAEMTSPWVKDEPATRLSTVASASTPRSTLAQSAYTTTLTSVGITGVVVAVVVVVGVVVGVVTSHVANPSSANASSISLRILADVAQFAPLSATIKVSPSHSTTTLKAGVPPGAGPPNSVASAVSFAATTSHSLTPIVVGSSVAAKMSFILKSSMSEQKTGFVLEVDGNVADGNVPGKQCIRSPFISSTCLLHSLKWLVVTSSSAWRPFAIRTSAHWI